ARSSAGPREARQGAQDGPDLFRDLGFVPGERTMPRSVIEAELVLEPVRAAGVGSEGCLRHLLPRQKPLQLSRVLLGQLTGGGGSRQRDSPESPRAVELPALPPARPPLP